jgi:hypothetical protein
VPLSQDEARFPMVPTLCRTAGVKRHRPMAGTRDRKGLLYAFAAVTAVTAAPHANTPEGPAGAARKAGRSKARASISGWYSSSTTPPGTPAIR